VNELAPLAGLAILSVVAMNGIVPAPAAEPRPLALESAVALGNIQGRVDHLALDTARRRLYVAELGNDSVAVIDLERSALVRTITGLNQPQGLAYIPSTDSLYVANAGDGSLRVFRAADLTTIDRIELGDDADNLRFDGASNLLFVGYGSGVLGIIDPTTRKKLADIQLKAHPEGFQLEPSGHRIYVNVPEAGEIAVVDGARNTQVASWKTRDLSSNFPLALDESRHEILVVFRHPAKLATFAMQDGAVLSSTDTCADSDDVFVDRKRERVYVSCGEGFVDTFARRAGSYARIDRLTTVAGARTSLYSPQLDRLYVAVRATSTTAAAIWILRPSP
jgi:YVTN family beta-propeller protein